MSDWYIWIDLETTGVDPVNDQILEITVIITDYNLNILAEYGTRILHVEENVLDNMSDWCKEQHSKSGLLKSVLESPFKLKDVSKEILIFISKIVPEKVGIIAGNSIHFDKEFLRYHMPKVFDWLSYKLLDVSSIKTCVKNWNQDIPKFEKENNHRSLDDIRESIAELKYYKNNIFLKN